MASICLRPTWERPQRKRSQSCPAARRDGMGRDGCPGAIGAASALTCRESGRAAPATGEQYPRSAAAPRSRERRAVRHESALPGTLRPPGTARAFKGSLAFLGARRANQRRRGRKREACARRATVGDGVPQSGRRGSGAGPRAEPHAEQRAAAADLPEAPLGGAPRAASAALVLLRRVPAPQRASTAPRHQRRAEERGAAGSSSRPGARRGRGTRPGVGRSGSSLGASPSARITVPARGSPRGTSRSGSAASLPSWQQRPSPPPSTRHVGTALKPRQLSPHSPNSHGEKVGGSGPSVPASRGALSGMSYTELRLRSGLFLVNRMSNCSGQECPV